MVGGKDLVAPNLAAQPLKIKGTKTNRYKIALGVWLVFLSIFFLYLGMARRPTISTTVENRMPKIPPDSLCTIEIMRFAMTPTMISTLISLGSIALSPSCLTLGLTGWQWSAAELPVRVEAVVRR